MIGLSWGILGVSNIAPIVQVELMACQLVPASQQVEVQLDQGGFRVWSLVFGVWGLGFRVWGLGFRV